jgi:hypothetical protein
MSRTLKWLIVSPKLNCVAGEASACTATKGRKKIDCLLAEAVIVVLYEPALSHLRGASIAQWLVLARGLAWERTMTSESSKMR